MINGKKVIAIIPARGGSKGIPNKNLRKVGGISLVGRAVKSAKDCPYVDKIVVSTDSRQIAAEAIKNGGEVPFLRPKGLSTDRAKTFSCISHVLHCLGESYDIVVVLQPTSPLREGIHLSSALELFILTEEKGVASVSPCEVNPFLLRIIDGEHNSKPIVPGNTSVRRQDIGSLYCVNGAIYINRASDYENYFSLNSNPKAFLMSAEDGIDIDDFSDLQRARRLFRIRNLA